MGKLLCEGVESRSRRLCLGSWLLGWLVRSLRDVLAQLEHGKPLGEVHDRNVVLNALDENPRVRINKTREI